MPYSSNGQLPPAVRKAYSDRCQSVFREAFNGAKGDEGSRMAQAHTAAKNCMHSMMKALLPLKAHPIDDDAFRLLAIPFGGPIPSPHSERGVDLDGEWFSERTDIKADWLPFRIVDWHHGNDPTGVMGRTVLGKAVLDREPDEEGHWVTVWLKNGERRLDLVRRLAEQGAQLYGSSESVPGMTRKAETGEVLVWPYMRQTLSTSPQNTYSVLRPLKATLDELRAEGGDATDRFYTDIEAAMRDLTTDLQSTSRAMTGAKAGREQAAMADLSAALDRLAEVAR